MRPLFASAALPVSVFSAAIANHAVSYSDWEVPDVSAYMEIVDDEDLESTEIIPALAALHDPRMWEEVTELDVEAEEGVLLA